MFLKIYILKHIVEFLNQNGFYKRSEIHKDQQGLATTATVFMMSFLPQLLPVAPGDAYLSDLGPPMFLVSCV